MGYWRNILWGTDYPHIEGTWRFLEDETEPYSQRSLRYSYHGLDLDKVEAMLGLNAIEVYGFDGAALHDIAQKINAPTRAPRSARPSTRSPTAASGPSASSPPSVRTSLFEHRRMLGRDQPRGRSTTVWVSVKSRTIVRALPMGSSISPVDVSSTLPDHEPCRVISVRPSPVTSSVSS